MKFSPYLLLTVAFWGLNFHFARIALQYTNFIEVGFWRYFLAVIVLYILAYKIKPKWAEVRNNFRQLFLMGFLGIFIFNLFFLYGLKYTTALNGALIVSINPAITLILSSLLLNTSLNRYSVGGVVVAFVGVLFLFAQGNLYNLAEIVPNKGDLGVLIATIIFAFYNIWGKKFSNKMSTSHLTFWTNLFGFLGFVLVIPFFGAFEFQAYDSPFWLSIAGLGILGSALAFTFWNKGLQRFGAYQTGIYGNLIPVCTALASPLFGETIETYHLISGGIVLLGLQILRMEK